MNDFVEMQTAKLNGFALDWATAYALNGTKAFFDAFGVKTLGRSITEEVLAGRIKPSQNWAQCGPLLEPNYIELSIGDEEYWARRTCTSKYDDERVSYAGSSMLIAACRAIVGEKLGQAVSVPKELLPC
jgi:hypothetical protein